MSRITQTENYFQSCGGYKICEVRTHNDREFLNKTHDSFFRDEGLHHQLTVPHNSFQNTGADRAHRTIQERARCLLIADGVPATLLRNNAFTRCCERIRFFTVGYIF